MPFRRTGQPASFESIVGTLFQRLGISEERDLVTDVSPSDRILGAFIGRPFGHNPPQVTIVDCPEVLTRWVVLGTIVDMNVHEFPLLVPIHRHPDETYKKMPGCGHCRPTYGVLLQNGWTHDTFRNLTTLQVGVWFRNMVDSFTEGSFVPEISCAPSFFAPNPGQGPHVDGDLPETIVGVSEHQNSGPLHWFPLARVPLGGSVYYFSERNTLYVFTHREHNRWEVTVEPKPRWPITSMRDGSQDFATLLDGAITAYRLVSARRY